MPDIIHNIDFIRNSILFSLINNDYSSVIKKLSDIIFHFQQSHDTSENDLKSMYQIQVLLKRFLNQPGVQVPETLKHLQKSLKHSLSNHTRSSVKLNRYIDFNKWKTSAGINDNQLKSLFETTSVFQLTTGCSNYCRRCNEWALPGTRKHFSFEGISDIVQKLHQHENFDFIIYGASDPLDWHENHRTIIDVTAMLSGNKKNHSFGLLTKIPKGKEKLFVELMKSTHDVSVSVTQKNRKRLKTIEKHTGLSLCKQHDTDDLHIPAGLDEDFCSVKSSVTDNYGTEITPDGAFIVIPTFTSALNPTGQHRIPVTDSTNFFLKKITGRQALSVDYFKPLEAIDLQGRTFKLKTLLDAQIETILLDTDSQQLTAPGMMNLKEHFSVYESKAVSRRKAMLPSVLKHYKQKHFVNNQFNNDSEKQQYLHIIKDYINFCKMPYVSRLKRYTMAFLLNSIVDYLKRNPVKKRIIQHLRQDDRDKAEYFKNLFSGNCSINELIETSGLGSYELFQFIIFRLLNDPEDSLTADFISKFHCIYDPLTDKFTADSFTSENFL